MLLGMIFALFINFVTSLFWVWVMMDLSTIFLIPFLCCGMSLTGMNKWYKGSATYFVVQFMGSASVLYSSLTLWESSLSVISLLFLVSGFMLKLGLFPLHFWVPRAFANFHYPAIYFTGVVQKVFIIFALPYVDSVNFTNKLIGLSAFFSILYGPVVMFNCTNIKTFLGYSSINNTGLMVACCIVTKYLFVFYAICYSVSMVFLLMILGVCMSDNIKEMGASLPNFYFWGFLSLGSSFSGFPPFTDFCAKFAVVTVYVDYKMWIFVLAVLLSSLVNLLAWIWVTVSIIRAMPAEDYCGPTLVNKCVNNGCILWNAMGGMLLLYLY
uniref:NADH-ubiquinone oxidoreductase chain 2 n=1 Tax=Saccostrea mordax TaxID=157729 RepID=A0A0U2A2E7_9BIVA|nr:NADH dehydrogenase subunit 2 [Saccostrea mordax]